MISSENLREELSSILEKTELLLHRMRAAQRIARGLSVALIGAPNAGKSTLFNALLAEDRAIVSPEAGTTRDVITEEIKLGPYYVRLADTAGLRLASGGIEQEGISRARELAEGAEVAIVVVDAAQPEEAIRRQLAELPQLECATVLALNKWELVDETKRAALLLAFDGWHGGGVVGLSAARGTGTDRLLTTLRSALDARVGVGVDALLPTEFQLQMLLASRSAIVQTLDLVKATGLSQPELISAGLGSAVRALSDLVGETTPDTVLAKIFSEFCIGK
ncbi:MAG: 50S ribosome-binding GTPase [Deltaproteobacteria bacterium]|nr:50S ribosome-binding GTPase [Deltaproteobacteria bacterium]